MQPVPVPSNILESEFKLFGSFTVKQFLKLFIGAAIAVVVFLIDINFIIKVPVMLISIGLGFFMAVIPRFSVLVMGFMKAVFITPRYLWVKEGTVPEILLTASTIKHAQDQKVTAAVSKKKLSVEKLPISEMFATRSQINPDYKQSADDSDSKSDDLLEDLTFNEGGASKIQEEMRRIYGNGNVNMQIIHDDKSSVNSNVSRSTSEQGMLKSRLLPLPRTASEISNEIKRLKFELSRLPKDINNYAEKERQILGMISELFHKLKSIGNTKNQQDSNVVNSASTSTVDSERIMSEVENSSNFDKAGVPVFGVVVDRNNHVVPHAKVIFVDKGNNSYSFYTDDTGRFDTKDPLKQGDYSVYIELPGKKFHVYKIQIGDQKLPGYKFREK